MHRAATFLIVSAAVAAAPCAAWAQAEAQASFEAGRAAYAKGDFAAAAEQFDKAAKTDVRNPEVFLWLGKARYQLGRVDEAMAAWTRTLQLAPDEPFAKRMLAALRGELTDANAKVRLIEALLAERLHVQALAQCQMLLRDKALTDARRAKVMTLQADAIVSMNRSVEALAVLEEIGVRFAGRADAAQVALLTGLAKLRHGAGGPAEALAILRKVVADHGGTAAAARAEYELIAWRIAERPDADAVADLARWIAAHPDHAQARAARRRLLDARLALVARLPAPKAGAELHALDAAVVAGAAELLADIARAGEARAVAKRVRTHLMGRYAKAGAYAAAIDGLERLGRARLDRREGLALLRDVATCRTELALRELTRQARAGKLPGEAMPELLTDAVAAWEAVTQAFADAPAWSDLAALAERVRRLAGVTPWPSEVTGPKPAYDWALGIALSVVKADADASAVNRAVKTVTAMVDDCTRFTGKPARGMALAMHTRLVEALSADHPSWPGTMHKQIDLLAGEAARVFEDNIKDGRAGDNADLSDPQKRMLAAMARLVGRQADQADDVLKKLAGHLKRWLDHGHHEAAVTAYEQLASAVPEAQRRAGELAVAGIWVHQVAAEHRRLLAAGLKVPRKLHPLHLKALLRCYALQDDLPEGDAFLRRVRAAWDGIVTHYRRLEYFDVAAEAVKAAPDAPAPAARAYARLRAANLLEAAARRELAESLEHYKAHEKIALTDGFKSAIAAYKTFITDHAPGPLVHAAAGRLEAIARLFVGHKAHDVAAGVYRDLAAFAQKAKVLAQAPPGGASTSERWELAACDTLRAKAVEALAKAVADAGPKADPPAKISAEFTAAIEAYKAFLKAHPDSVLVGRALGQVMSAGLEYARVAAWDVAEGIYAGLLAPELARPERIEFCRGLCHLGKVMPDHAREVLSALTSAGVAVPKSALTRDMPDLPAWDYDERLGDVRKALRAGEDISEGGRSSAGPSGRARSARMAPAEPGAVSGLAARRRPPARPAPPKTTPRAESAADELAKADTKALAAIRAHQQQRAARVAQMRAQLQYKGGKRAAKDQRPKAPVLSDAEIARQEKALDAAYKVFQGIRANHPRTPTAEQARGEIMVMVQHWRGIQRWRRAAELVGRYLADNPADPSLPPLRLAAARDLLAWAGRPPEKALSRQERLAEVADRFKRARAALAAVVKDFPGEKATVHAAQWEIANSFLTQARAVDAFSPTLARGQYVRAAAELRRIAEAYHDHPNIGQVPQMLWDIANELSRRGYHDEAITVFNGLIIRYPTHALAARAAERIAQIYRSSLQRPLLAAETYLEINFARGGNDLKVQNQIFEIGSALKNEKRWVEALHVLEVFVDSFPRHPSAGQALTMVGQIHQANEAWADAIAAYERVIGEYPSGAWVRDAKWSIAECTINLSRWREAQAAYRSYLAAYAKDARAAEANRRLGILKDLVRYQGLVDEEGQRKAFDAQYQIAETVLGKLSNPVKAVIEYRKVTARWPQSHLADDALFKVGTTYLSMNETAKARTSLRAVAERYATSPLADDALYLIGKSYQDEAQRLVRVTRGESLEMAQKKAQHEAYAQAQGRRQANLLLNDALIERLRKEGKNKQAEMQGARFAGQQQFFQRANVAVAAQMAGQKVEQLTAAQLAERQDKINAALRDAVDAYASAAKVPTADKADEALLLMAGIYAEKLKDVDAAMRTYREIVRQFTGTAVAEDASWRIARHHERQGQYDQAIRAYEAFLRNYRRSARAHQAQFAVAENYEHLGQWVKAMDAYTNYINNFPDKPLVQKAREQINWIKTYRL